MRDLRYPVDHIAEMLEREADKIDFIETRARETSIESYIDRYHPEYEDWEDFFMGGD